MVSRSRAKTVQVQRVALYAKNNFSVCINHLLYITSSENPTIQHHVMYENLIRTRIYFALKEALMLKNIHQTSIKTHTL